MRIQLVHPPVYVNVRSVTALRPSLPQGLAYVAATLRRAGHRVGVLDALGEAIDRVTPGPRRAISLLGLTPAQLVDRLDPSADAFGVTCQWSFSWPVVRELIRAMKLRFPDTPVVCGGEHVTGLPEMSMAQAPIDVVVLGEGEAAALDVFGALERGESLAAIDGIWYRDASGAARKSPRERARIRALDEIPWPAWDLFDVRAYDESRLINGIRYGMTVPVLATRGCPYQCTYCSNPHMWGTRWQARDPADVVAEMQHWHEVYGADNFPFHDLTAILKKDWIVAFCRELAARPFHSRIAWQLPSGTRVEVVDAEVARWMVRTNGRSLNYAPESGSAATRERIKKRMTDAALLRAVRAAVDNRLVVAAFFVVGFPHDTADDLRRTVALVRRLAWHGITDVACAFFFPIPNTELYRELVAGGRIELSDDFLLTPIFANDPSVAPENVYSEHLTAAQLTRWRAWLTLNFYAVSFMTRPWRLLTLAWHTLAGVETRKLETFLIDIGRRLRLHARGVRAG